MYTEAPTRPNAACFVNVLFVGTSSACEHKIQLSNYLSREASAGVAIGDVIREIFIVLF